MVAGNGVHLIPIVSPPRRWQRRPLNPHTPGWQRRPLVPNCITTAPPLATASTQPQHPRWQRRPFVPTVSPCITTAPPLATASTQSHSIPPTPRWQLNPNIPTLATASTFNLFSILSPLCSLPFAPPRSAPLRTRPAPHTPRSAHAPLRTHPALHTPRSFDGPRPHLTRSAHQHTWSRRRPLHRQDFRTAPHCRPRRQRQRALCVVSAEVLGTGRMGVCELCILLDARCAAPVPIHPRSTPHNKTTRHHECDSTRTTPPPRSLANTHNDSPPALFPTAKCSPRCGEKASAVDAAARGCTPKSAPADPSFSSAPNPWPPHTVDNG